MKNFMIIFMVGLSFYGFSQQNPSTENYSDGTVKTIVQPTGKNTSLVKKFDENSNLLETGNWKDGYKDKSWISYCPDGNIATIGNFDNGVREGTWLIFDEKGKVKYEITYENNRVVNAFDWEATMAAVKDK